MDVKKTSEFDTKTSIEWSRFWTTRFISFFSVYWLCVFFICVRDLDNLWNTITTSLCLTPFFLVLFTVLVVISRGIVIKKKRKNYFEELKFYWWWIIKKLKINEIKECYRKDDDGSRFGWYIIVTKDWDNEYSTERFINSWIKYTGCWWQTYEILNYLNVEFNPLDIKWTKDILKQKKSELESEIWLDSRFYSKIWKKNMLREVNKLLDTFDDWAKIPILEINWKKITIWDEMTVIVDPNDNKNYMVDTDFLFLSPEECEDKQIKILKRNENKQTKNWFFQDFLEVILWMFKITLIILLFILAQSLLTHWFEFVLNHKLIILFLIIWIIIIHFINKKI